MSAENTLYKRLPEMQSWNYFQVKSVLRAMEEYAKEKSELIDEENKKLKEALHTAHHLILSGKGICDYDKDLSMKWATTDVESLLSQPKEETL